MSMFGNLEPGKGTRRPTGTYYLGGTTPRIPGPADFAGTVVSPQEKARAQFNWGANFPTPKNMPTKDPLAEMRGGNLVPSRLEALGRAGGARGVAPTPRTPSAPTPRGGAGGGVSSLFAPLFQALDQQLANAESRYAENAGQIQNIYGQLIGARKADITDIQTAYQRLQQAAATRGTETLTGMQTRESGRLTQNEAVLESMGIGDIGTTAGDIASQSAAVAQDVERMNQSNWAGMLDAMGATSQDIARADITSYGYAQMEDIAALQAARENMAQDIANQEFELKFQEQQAKLQAQQAAAANAARVQAANIKAAQEAQRDQYERTQAFLKGENPLSNAIGRAALEGAITEANGPAIRQAYSEWFQKSPVAKNTMATRASALADLEAFIAPSKLSEQEKNVLRTAISNTFSK